MKLPAFTPGRGFRRDVSLATATATATALLVGGGVGCAPLGRAPAPAPRSSAWHHFTNGQGNMNVLHVEVNPTGPPRWNYLVESLDSTVVTNTPPPDWTGTGWFPTWHQPGIALTNVAINLSGCPLVSVSSNWQVQGGSTYIFENTNGATELRFTLVCDHTNGAVALRAWDSAGTTTDVKNLSGPR